MINASYEDVSVECEQHGKATVRVMVFHNRRFVEPKCPQCAAIEEDEKKKIADEKQARDEARRRQHRIESALQSAMIPLRFQQHSFETFEEKTESHTKRKERCQKYAENFPEISKRGTSMIFSGTTGTGKTHLACAIANYIITKHEKTAVFMGVADAVRRVKETYRKKSEETEREAIRWFLYPDLLILDEIGVQFGTETEKNILFEIINKRYEDMKPSILLSNLSPENLKEFVGDRIMDRMKQNDGRVLVFNWSSYRDTTENQLLV